MTTTTSPSTVQVIRAGLFLVLMSFGSFVMLGMPDGIRGAAWPSIYPEFGVSIGSLGVWLTMGTFGYMVSSFNSGRVLARLGTGRALSLGIGLMGTAVIAYTLVPSWWMLVALGFVFGLGSGTIDAGLNTFVAAHFPPSLMYWLHASFGLGTTLGPLVMVAVISVNQSWRVAYLFAGSIQLTLALIFWLTQKRWNDEPHPSASAQILAHKTPANETLRVPDVWLSVLFFFIYAAVEFTPNEWGVSIMTKERGLDPTTAASWMSTYWGAFTIGRIVPGFITRFLPVNTYLRVMMLGMIVGAGLFALNPTPELGLIGLPILGFSIAPIFPALISSTESRVGVKHVANSIGFQIAGVGFGIGLLQLLAGQIAERISLQAVTVFIVAVAILLLVLHEVMLARTRRTLSAKG